MDILKILCPEKANWDCKSSPPARSRHGTECRDAKPEFPPNRTPDIRDMEGRLPKLYGSEAVEIPGARSLLDSLIKENAPWAIVTSGTEPLVGGWLDALSLPKPPHLISAESVENGKPDPTCYLIGREKLGLEDSSKTVLVLEDSPAGIRAGKAAGCKVVGLVTSHTAEQVLSAEPDWIVRDLESVRLVRMKDGRATLEFANCLVPAANPVSTL